jgi:hypothetical protein
VLLVAGIAGAPLPLAPLQLLWLNLLHVAPLQWHEWRVVTLASLVPAIAGQAWRWASPASSE